MGEGAWESFCNAVSHHTSAKGRRDGWMDGWMDEAESEGDMEGNGALIYTGRTRKRWGMGA